MTYNPKKKAYNQQYTKENYKRVPLDIQKSDYDKIKAAADTTGTTVNGFIKECIREKLESLQHSGIISGDNSTNNDSNDSNN